MSRGRWEGGCAEGSPRRSPVGPSGPPAAGAGAPRCASPRGAGCGAALPGPFGLPCPGGRPGGRVPPAGRPGPRSPRRLRAVGPSSGFQGRGTARSPEGGEFPERRASKTAQSDPRSALLLTHQVCGIHLLVCFTAASLTRGMAEGFGSLVPGPWWCGSGWGCSRGGRVNEGTCFPEYLTRDSHTVWFLVEIAVEYVIKKHATKF